MSNSSLVEREQILDELATRKKEIEVILVKKDLFESRGIAVTLEPSAKPPFIPWRTRHDSTTGQFNLMRRMSLDTDCKIIVGSEDEPNPHEENVHRLQLIRASPVFEAMLMAHVSEPDTSVIIKITDLSQKAVQKMIHFIYCDEIQLATFDEAYEVALAAEKYQIKQLLDISVSLLLKFVSHDNVWSALKLANHLKQQDLTDSCIEVLQMSPLKCIYSEEFMHTSEENLILFLKQEVINFANNELLLVNATINWARDEAQRRGLTGDDAGVRTVIEPNILRLLRLATIPLEQFKTGPGLSDWLTRSEKEQIMEHNQLGNSQNLPEHLSSSKKQREIPKKIDDYKKRKVRHCKRKVITKESNFKLLNRMAECIVCKRLIQSLLYFVKPESICAHGGAIFRVNSKCRFWGFECPSRVLHNLDPTLLNSKNRKFYNEKLLISFMDKGSTLDKSQSHKPQSIFSMTYKKKTMYDSSIVVKFPKPVKLKENNWYALFFMFYSPGDENVPMEYPYCTRPDKVVCKTSGVKFVIQTEKIPGYWNSKNDGLFKTFFVTKY